MVSQELIKPPESLFESWSQIFSVISNRNRLIVLVALFDDYIDNGEGIPFLGLRQITGLPKNSLNYHINVLRDRWLIENVPKNPYRITDEGRRVLEKLGITEELLIKYRQTK